MMKRFLLTKIHLHIFSKKCLLELKMTFSIFIEYMKFS